MWKEKCVVPSAWRDAILVLNHDKGNLSSCDNWRGTYLLTGCGGEGGGKDPPIQERFQKLAEEVP